MYSRRALCALSISLLVLPLGAKDKNGFDGKWQLDAEASQCSATLPENFQQQIKVKGDKTTVESSWREPKGGIAPLILLGIMASRVELATNGSESSNQVGPALQVSKTTFDGNKMSTEWTAQINGEVMKGNWVRTLSEDGKQMTLDIQESGGGKGDQSAKLVFRRK